MKIQKFGFLIISVVMFITIFSCSVPQVKKTELTANKNHILVNANTKWENLNKSDYKELMQFIREQDEVLTKYNKELEYKYGHGEFDSLFSSDGKNLYQNMQLKEIPHVAEAKELYSTILDQKVKKYLNSKYSSLSSYCDRSIYYINGTQSYKLYQIFRIPILKIIPGSGYKFDFDLKKVGDNLEFTIKTNTTSEFIITYKPTNDGLVLIGLRSGLQINPQNWEYMYGVLADSLVNFPLDETLDTKLIDSL